LTTLCIYFLSNEVYIVVQVVASSSRYGIDFFFFFITCADMRLVAKRHYLWHYLNLISFL